MAYSFSHQWRDNYSKSQGLGNCELGKANWGWSWKEHWIAARLWKSCVATVSNNAKKAQNNQSSKTDKKTSTPKTPISAKPASTNPKGTLDKPIFHELFCA
ncbi:hypothetical protein HN51_069563 [Arachis hypogaea]|uniref:Uncharacterized protein n=1 Tax=Arachis hypogaea TaxID=3818 RepID=A0A444Z5E1_ARAHY|nr:hypothetical protein Ahy_B05g077746 [Arachis hypogaea]